MATASQHPLTLAEAKVNLRTAGDALSARQVIRQHPWESLGLAFALGLLLADDAVMTNLARNSDLLRAFSLAFTELDHSRRQ